MGPVPGWGASAVKAIVTVLLLAIVARNVELAPVFARLAGIAWYWVLAAAIAFAGQLALSGLRWYYVCDVLGTSISGARALGLMVIGHFFSQTLPSGVGGDAVRAWLLARSGAGMRGAVSAVLCDRLFAMTVLLVLMDLTIPTYVDRVGNQDARMGLPVVTGALTVGTLLFVALGPVLLARFSRFRFGNAAHLTLVDLRHLMFRVRPSLLAMALLVHGGVILTCFALAKALGVSVGILDCVIIVPPVMLVSALPLSIAGWGVREGAMVAGFGLLDIPTDAALSISIAFGLLQLALSIPGGLLWALWGRESRTAG